MMVPILWKVSSEEIESKYYLIKMLLTEPENCIDPIYAIKKEIAHKPIELKKLEEENIIFLMNRKWHST